MKMDYKRIILIFQMLFSKGWCKNGTLLAMNGCFKDSELRGDEKNSSIYIEQNYPGLCLQTCIHQKRTHPVAVALQDKSCLCLNRRYTQELPETSTRNCTETCPGHDEMYCGHTAVNCYSSYSISEYAIDTAEEELCAANEKGSPELTMRNCSESLPTFCYNPSGHTCEEMRATANWGQVSQKCNGFIHLKVQYYTTGSRTEMDLCTGGISNVYNAIPFFWIPAFGQNAPTVPCPELIAPLHGYITLNANPRIAEYTCESGFELSPNGTRFCLANRTWNGTTPICQHLETTTLITATSTEATADTTTKVSTTNMTAVETSLIIETTTSSPSPRATSSSASSSTTLLTSSSSTTETPIVQSSESNNEQTIGIVVGVSLVVVGCVCIGTWCFCNRNCCRRNNRIADARTNHSFVSKECV